MLWASRIDLVSRERALSVFVHGWVWCVLLQACTVHTGFVSVRCKFSHDAANSRPLRECHDGCFWRVRCSDLLCHCADSMFVVTHLWCCPSQPSKVVTKTTMTRDFRRVAKSIKKVTSSTHYRADLQKGQLQLEPSSLSAPRQHFPSLSVTKGLFAHRSRCREVELAVRGAEAR